MTTTSAGFQMKSGLIRSVIGFCSSKFPHAPDDGMAEWIFFSEKEWQQNLNRRIKTRKLRWESKKERTSKGSMEFQSVLLTLRNNLDSCRDVATLFLNALRWRVSSGEWDFDNRNGVRLVRDCLKEERFSEENDLEKTEKTECGYFWKKFDGG